MLTEWQISVFFLCLCTLGVPSPLNRGYLILILLVMSTGWALGNLILEDYRTCQILRGDLGILLLLALLWHFLAWHLGLLKISAWFRLLWLDSWIAALPFLLIYLISRGKWLGGGDVRLMWVIGFWLGGRDAFLVLWLGCILGFLGYVVRKKSISLSLGDRIPLAPGIGLIAGFAAWMHYGTGIMTCLVGWAGKGGIL